MRHLTYSHQNYIYKELLKEAIKVDKIFGKKFILIKKKSFDKYKFYFRKSFDLFNHETNYRTLKKIKHIHAINHKNLVQIHYDYGNVDIFLLYGLIHLFIDVIPYFTYYLIHWTKPYHIEKK